MKKVLALISIVGMLSYGTSNYVFAQDGNATNAATTTTVDNKAPAQTVATEAPKTAETVNPAEKTFHYMLKEKFIQGSPGWMAPILICLILGLAIAIERIIYLNLATTNTTKLLNSVEEALNTGGVESAKEVCRNTKGPIASIFYQGLDRINEGIENVEKSVIAYGGVQMGRLESGLTWLALFIALAPMLGFLGTVVGMVQAFEAIEVAGDISPQIVAGGMKVALITTVFGLIVAIGLQILYNYILSKIDGIVNAMEDSSISLIDLLVKNKVKKS